MSSIFGNGTDAVPIPKFIYALRIWEGNKFMDFKEHAAGPDIAAQIDLGHYLPDDAATALELAINQASSGASGASAIYDVSYDRSTDKYTISRTASGASAFDDEVIETCSATAGWTVAREGKALIPATGDTTEGATAFETGIDSGITQVGEWQRDVSASGYTFENIGGLLVDINIFDTEELVASPAIQLKVKIDESNYKFINRTKASLASGWNADIGGVWDDWTDQGSATGAITEYAILILASAADYEIVSGNIKIDNVRLVNEDRFDILFNSGSNAASGAGTAYGYDVATDATGRTSYESDNQLPNRIVPSQPIRSPEARFRGENRESITESGIHTANHIRTDIFFEWAMTHILENELQDDWAEWMGKVDEVEGPWAQKLEFEFYPKATDTVNYIVLHPDDADWEPVEMVSINLPAFYRWQMATREVIPKAGTISLVDIYSRIPG